MFFKRLGLFTFTPWFDGDNPPGGGGGTGTNPEKKEATTETKTYTQAELDALFTDRANRAADTATKKLLETLGVKDADEAKAKLTKAKEAEDAQLSELQKAQKAKDDAEAAAAKAKSDANAALAKAQRKLMVSAIQLEAAKQNFDDGEVTSVQMAILNDQALLDLIKAKDDGESFDGVDKAVKKVADAHPRWLKTATRTATGTPQRGQQGSAKGNGQGNEQKPGPRVAF